MRPNKKFSVFILVLIALSVIIIPSLAAVLFVNLEADIVSGTGDSHPRELMVFNGELIFEAYHPSSGYELWRFDGTTAEIIDDFYLGGANNAADGDGSQYFTEYNGILYFRLRNASGARLCSYDGSVIEIIDSTALNPTHLLVYNEKLYFSGLLANNTRQMFNYDDTGAGTITQVSTLMSGFDPRWMIEYSGNLYFSANDMNNTNYGDELWKCDDCDNFDYSLAANINTTVNEGSQPTKLTVFNGELLFIARDSLANGFELWSYDGTSATIVDDINAAVPGDGIYPGAGWAFDISESQMVFQSAVYNGVLYYMADDGSHGNELWDYDGTTASLVKDINTAGDSDLSYPVYFNGELYFTANDGSLPADMLFSYDGTDANPAFDPANPPWGTYPVYTTVYDGKLFAGAVYQYGAGAGDTNGYELVSFSLTADDSDDDVDTNDIDLPATGFSPGIITTLPQQTIDKAYDNLGDLWLEIPALDVEATIMGVPVKEEGWDLRWLSNQVGWLEGTAFPTWAGNSALTAHVYDANGQPGPFKDLNTLKWGDEITVHFYGQEYTYEVRDVDEYIRPDDNRSVLTHEELPYLTLITCQGYDEDSDSYRWRIAVRAVQTKIN